MTKPDVLPPAAQTALDFVQEQLEKGRWQPGQRMPSSLKLAHAAGVGASSMARAVVELKSRGLVNGLRRGCLRAGADNRSSKNWREQPDSLWQMKRAALEKDILSGTFTQEGELPSLKELQARYSTCFATMKKILQSMVQEGVVDIKGRKYGLPDSPQTRSNKQIVCITNKFQTTPFSALNQNQHRVINTLEFECIRRGLTLDLLELDLHDSSCLARISDSRRTVAYVLDVWWYTIPEFRASYLDILNRLSRTKKPVAIVDEISSFVLPFPFATNPLIQVFRVEGKSAGGRMARLLMNLGHSSVAFISTTETALWSQQRLEGIEEQFAKAGMHGGVHRFIQEYPTDYLPLLLALSDLDDAVILKVLRVMRTRRQAEGQYRAVMEARHGNFSRDFKRSDILALRRDLAALGDVVNGRAGADIFRTIFQAVQRQADIRFSPMILVPLFEQALQDRSVTAWICASDILAIAALTFLRDRHMDVPGNLSVVGFDNIPLETLEYRLTSFDFNAAGFMYRMADYLVRPPKPRGGYRHSPIEVEGLVVVRGTTGKARLLQKHAPGEPHGS